MSKIALILMRKYNYSYTNSKMAIAIKSNWCLKGFNMKIIQFSFSNDLYI